MRADTPAVTAPDYFSAHARAWDRLGPPLRPAAEDVRIAERCVASTPRRSQHAGLRALILGVTPELACMRWPAGTTLLAVDRSQDMIDAVWPGERLRCPGRALCGDWSELPLESGAADAVLGDGSFTLLGWPDPQRVVCREIRRVLAAEGRLLLRVFVCPEARESLEGVFEALHAGGIGSFHAFKWRLAMSLQAGPEEGVLVRDVWHAWQDRAIDRDALARRLGWSRDAIDSIDAYREAGSRLCFPTLQQMRALLAEEFRELACHVPAYELGARCPTLLLAPIA